MEDNFKVCNHCNKKINVNKFHKQMFRGKLVTYKLCQKCWCKTRSHPSSRKNKTLEYFYGNKKANQIRKQISINTKKAMNNITVREKCKRGQLKTCKLRKKNNTYKGVNKGYKHSPSTIINMKIGARNKIKKLGYCPGGFQKGNKNIAKRLDVRKKLREKALNNIQKILTGPITPFRGKNETQILNNIEKEKNIKLIRQYKISGYFLDGYDKENNVVYEVDEKYHLKQQEKDILRQQEIIKELNCEFIRIKDY